MPDFRTLDGMNVSGQRVLICPRPRAILRIPHAGMVVEGRHCSGACATLQPFA